jgi:hypothetical protein
MDSMIADLVDTYQALVMVDDCRTIKFYFFFLKVLT